MRSRYYVPGKITNTRNDTEVYFPVRSMVPANAGTHAEPLYVYKNCCANHLNPLKGAGASFLHPPICPTVGVEIEYIRHNPIYFSSCHRGPSPYGIHPTLPHHT